MAIPFKLTGQTYAIKQRQKVEQTIARAVVDALLPKFSLGVYDGDGLVLHHSTDRKAILEALFNTDEDYLYVYTKGGNQKDKRPDYWVRFVYGNDGWDVICDYSVYLEQWIGEGTTIDTLIKKFE